jgi:hypothetical protein
MPRSNKKKSGGSGMSAVDEGRQVWESDGRATSAPPFFSVCIPQYNRTDFLLEALRRLACQTAQNFEVCISDDCSPDGRYAEIVAALKASGRPFRYERQTKNLRYDGNTRAAIDMSRGRFCYLMGNDDCPATDDEFENLQRDIENAGNVGAVISNFKEIPTGNVVRRMPRTGSLGAGPKVAASNFRNYSFVTGVVLDGERARALTTSRWDGSEMYQMYLGSRIVAEGKQLLSLARVSVLKDIQIPGQQIDSYAARPRLDPCPIIERKHTFHLLAPLVIDAITPYTNAAELPALREYVISQVLAFTYPFWIFEHRKLQSWNYAAGICLGMRVRNIVRPGELDLVRAGRVHALYALVTAAGLLAPVEIFTRAKPTLHRLAKSPIAERLLSMAGKVA